MFCSDVRDDIPNVLHALGQQQHHKRRQSDRNDVGDANPQDAESVIHAGEVGQRQAGDENHRNAEQGAQRERLHDELLLAFLNQLHEVELAVLQVEECRQRSRQTNRDAVGDGGMQRDEAAGEQRPHDGSDIAGEETGHRPKKVADHGNDERKGAEMYCAGNQRNRAQIGPQYACKHAEDNEKDDVNDADLFLLHDKSLHSIYFSYQKHSAHAPERQ